MKEVMMKYLKYGTTIRFNDVPQVPERMRGKLGVVHYQAHGSELAAVTLWGEGPDKIVFMPVPPFEIVAEPEEKEEEEEEEESSN